MKFYKYIEYGLILVIFYWIYSWYCGNNIVNTTDVQLQNILSNDEIKLIDVNIDRIDEYGIFSVNNTNTTFVEYYGIYLPKNDNSFINNIKNQHDKINITYYDRSKTITEYISFYSGFIFICIVVFCIYCFFTIINQLTNMVKTNQSKTNDDENDGLFEDLFCDKLDMTIYDGEINPINTKMSDVIGQVEAKHQIEKYIDIMKYYDVYKQAGAKLPKGVLFSGPPGCGKTLLAKAIAGEAGVSFIALSGSDFDEKFVGVGSSRVKKLFKKARKIAPCIIFIDELDSIGVSRDTPNRHSRETLNKLLSEFDGIKENENILVIGATNHMSVLDNALTRSGRFDTKIHIEYPTFDERVELFKYYIDKINNKFVDLSIMKINDYAKLTAGASGADIVNICNHLIINTIKNIHINDNNSCENVNAKENEIASDENVNAKENEIASDENVNAKENELLFDNIKITNEQMYKSIEDVLFGLEKKSRKAQNEEIKITAYHEMGHALIGYLFKDHQSPLSVSIIPRSTGVVGYTYLPNSDNYIKTRANLIAEICCLLAGRVAEQLKFDDILTTGASNDFEKATDIARKIISKYGMTLSLGNMYYEHDINKPNHISEKMRGIVDDTTLKIINNCYDMTHNIVKKYYHQLEILSTLLIERETINYDDIKNVINIDENIITIDKNFSIM